MSGNLMGLRVFTGITLIVIQTITVIILANYG